MVREDAWYDFNFLKFTEVWFVTQDLVYPGECSMCTWEDCVFSCMWMECPEDINEISSNVSFKTCVSLLIFCFDNLSIGVSRVLKSPTIIVLLSISPFMSVSACLCIDVLLCWVHIYNCYVFLLDQSLMISWSLWSVLPYLL